MPGTPVLQSCTHPKARVWFYRDGDTYMICPECLAKWRKEAPVRKPSALSSQHRQGE